MKGQQKAPEYQIRGQNEKCNIQKWEFLFAFIIPQKLYSQKQEEHWQKNKHHPFKMDLKRETPELSLVNNHDNHTPCEKI